MVKIVGSSEEDFFKGNICTLTEKKINATLSSRWNMIYGFIVVVVYHSSNYILIVIILSLLF